MYIQEAVPDLVTTLSDLCGPDTEVLIAHGRNRSAEDLFLAALAARKWSVSKVAESVLHPSYVAPDVTVLSVCKPHP